jgi:LacI family transcriptional regulator
VIRKAPTIVQIAKILGVAPSTVSRAFTDPGKLLPETVERVLATANRIGYVPNNHARALITGRSSVIGLVVPDIANPFFPPIIRYAQRAAEERGLSLIIADADGDPERESHLVGRLTPQVEGLILASSRLPEQSLLTIAERLPTVLINRDVAGISRVLVNTGDALDEAIDGFVARGHRRIAYVGGPERSWSNQERHARVVAAVERHGLASAFFAAPAGTYAEALELAEPVSRSGATAVIAFDDVVAHGLMSGFQALRRRVPEAIEVLGCDDTLATTTFPALSTVALDLAEAARRAVALLQRPPRGERASEPREARVELEGRLVLRGSTRPAPMSAPSVR